jgi:hypothetical protein
VEAKWEVLGWVVGEKMLADLQEVAKNPLDAWLYWLLTSLNGDSVSQNDLERAIAQDPRAFQFYYFLA